MMRSPLRRTVLLIIVVIVILAGLSITSLPMLSPASSPRPAVLLIATSVPGASINNEGDQPVSYQPPSQRMVIKNATLTLIVQDTAAALNTIGQIAEEVKGWVVDSKTAQSTSPSGATTTQGTINIRVPAEQFTDVLDRIKKASLSVDSEDILGEDVTQTYTDLQSQLTNLQAAETQLRTIMNSATNTPDVLAVYAKLVDIQGQIEVIKGRMQFYQQSAAFSSISVTLLTQVPDKPVEIAGWNPQGIVGQAFVALIVILQIIISLLIWLVIVGLPLALLFGIPTWIGLRIVRWWQRRTATPQTKPADGE